MSATPTRNVALTKALEARIKAEVASVRYGSCSGVVRSGLSLPIGRDEARAEGGSRHAR